MAVFCLLPVYITPLAIITTTTTTNKKHVFFPYTICGCFLFLFLLLCVMVCDCMIVNLDVFYTCTYLFLYFYHISHDFVTYNNMKICVAKKNSVHNQFGMTINSV